MRGLYIHLPFCISKCPYCDFVSYMGKLPLAKTYLDCVLKEAQGYAGERLETLYLGGGTPTCVETGLLLSFLKRLKSLFVFPKDMEFTIEANPATIDSEKLCAYRTAGINRLSLGAQSFQPALLRTLGRLHRPEDVYRGVQDALSAGFQNISLDLMFSLPGQTLQDWQADLQAAASMEITHLSCYGLKIEPGTPFFRKGIQPLEEDTDRALYHFAVSYLSKQGFEQYEISNFARRENYSHHNLLYWQCREYIGLGAGAHSYVNGSRYYNTGNLDQYINDIQTGGTGRSETITLTARDRLVERFIMGMRLCRGVEETVFYALDGKDKLERYLSAGFLQRNQDKISFTTKGFDVSNTILADFL